MARTKKYLTSSAGRSKPGFYRPIKRLKQSQESYSPISSSKSNPPLKQDAPELNELEEKIKQAQRLKEELDQKIKTQLEKLESIKQIEKVSQKHNSTLSPVSETELPASETSLSEEFSLPKSIVEQEAEVDNKPDFVNHDVNEKLSLIEKEIEHSSKKESRLKKELEEMKDSFTDEKKKLESTIKSLRKDMHRSEPITKNKFFTISKELQEVVQAMNQLIESEKIAVTTPVNQPAPVSASPAPVQPEASQTNTQVSTSTETNTSPQESQPQTQPAAKPEEQKPEQATTTQSEQSRLTQEQPAQSVPVQDKLAQNQPSTKQTPTQPEKNEKKGFFSKIPKPLVVLGSTILLVSIIGGVVWMTLNRNTEVDTTLLQEYLPPDAQPVTEQAELGKKINESSQPTTPPETQTQSQPQTKGVSDEKYAESQANVPFAETQWDTIKDGTIGIQLNYPKNAVNVIKTDSSITFIRKTGYIFKIQVAETALEVKEYWKLIKASSLNYKVKETTFKNKEALFLELEDFSEYPGDKYLVKHNDYIFDIWYATFSPTLSEDDAKRIDVILSSLEFI